MYVAGCRWPVQLCLRAISSARPRVLDWQLDRFGAWGAPIYASRWPGGTPNSAERPSLPSMQVEEFNRHHWFAFQAQSLVAMAAADRHGKGWNRDQAILICGEAFGLALAVASLGARRSPLFRT
jgi:hypothetical protein